MTRCWSCQTEISPGDFQRGDSCLSCGRDTKCCRNCVFYDPMANNQCRENQAERVVDKERSNFCDYFHPREGGSPGAAPGTSRSDARAAAEALFKKR